MYVVANPVWESDVQNCSLGVYIAAGYGAFLWFVGVFTSWYSRLGTCDVVRVPGAGSCWFGVTC
jgi:hypothetical protein